MHSPESTAPATTVLERAFLTQRELASVLGISLKTVSRGIASGEIPATRLRGRVLVPVSFVKRLAKD